jgi:hypothetical protein
MPCICVSNVGMCVATGKGNMFIAMCKPTIFINITRNPYTLFIFFIHLYLATCFAHR